MKALEKTRIETAYNLYLKAVKDKYSDKTVNQYKYYLDPLIKRIGNYSLKEVAEELIGYIKGYYLSMFDTKAKKRNFLAAYQSFRKFIEEMYEVVFPTIPSSLIPPKEDKKPKPIETEHFKELLEKIKNLKDVENQRERNISFKLAFFLMAFAGLRVSEALAVREKDIYYDKDKKILKVFVKKGKGNKERIAYIVDPEAVNDILEHVDYLPIQLRREAIFRRLKRLGKINPHRLRDTYLTNLVENEVPLEVAQTLAGHSKADMTLKYVRISERRILSYLNKIGNKGQD